MPIEKGHMESCDRYTTLRKRYAQTNVMDINIVTVKANSINLVGYEKD